MFKFFKNNDSKDHSKSDDELLFKPTNKTTFTIKFAPCFFDPNQILSAYRYYQLVEVYPLLLYQEENALSSF